jgi:GNAT superfamily N-acetyltransferase
MYERTNRLTWPEHLNAGAVRFAHVSGRYESSIAFYRDLLGLPIVGTFTGSFGEDGTVFGLPDTTLQIEIVRARGASPPVEVGQLVNQLTFYLNGAEAVDKATAPMRDAGLLPEAQPHPYWAANGAVVYRDPDGYEIVFAPWVYGRDPDPIDRIGAPSGQDVLRLEWYAGDRDALRPLFAEAEDSQEQLEAYINDGRVLVAWLGEHPVGHLQLVPTQGNTVEVKNMAVAGHLRGRGIGRALVETALAGAATQGAHSAIVATAAADIGNLRFYQRCGFRFSAIEQDAFTPEAGYPAQSIIDGIPLRDRVWLDRPVARMSPTTHSTSASR